MSITGGNLINKFAFNIPYRAVSLQLSRKSGVVLKCSKGKEYSSSSSSSIPVRYIPKKSTRTENAEITSPGRSCNNNQNSRCDSPQSDMLSSYDGYVEDRRSADERKSSGREDSVHGPKRWSYFSIHHNPDSGEKTCGHLRVPTSNCVEGSQGTRGLFKNGGIAFGDDQDQLGVVPREGMSYINAPNILRHETLRDEQNAQGNLVSGKNSNIGSQNSSEINGQMGVSTYEFVEGTRDFVEDVDAAYSGHQRQPDVSTRGGLSTSISPSSMFRHETLPDELNAHKHLFRGKTSDTMSQKSYDISPVVNTELSQEIHGHPRVATSQLMEEPKNVVEDGGGQMLPQYDISRDTRGLDGRMVSGNNDERRSEKKSSNMSRYVKPVLEEQISLSSKNLNEETDHVVMADTEFMEEPEEDIEKEAFNNSEECKSTAYQKTKQDVERIAVGLLAKRAFTTVELQKKLTAKSFPLLVVENVIHDFQKRGLINDRLYAETFSQSRWSTSSWGPRKIQQELGMKGVSQGDVTRAMKLVFEDDESAVENSRINLSRSALEQLHSQAYKRWLRCQNVPREKRKARIVNWLQYRGFNWDVVSIILKKLESQQSPWQCPP